MPDTNLTRLTDEQIVRWEDIQDDFDDCVLLGNGSSIAVSPNFAYSSLYDVALADGLMEDIISELFEYFDTRDFEFILRMIWHSKNINLALGIPDDKTDPIYQNVKSSLIAAVREIHSDYNDVEDKARSASSFLSHFDTILSLNYDIIVYWAILLANECNGGIKFKDCFIGGNFDHDWEKYRNPIYNQTKCPLVFYPHGNLLIATDAKGRERKLQRPNGTGRLLEEITEQWRSEECVPLFVSEGISTQKENAILRSSYLSTVYNSVLPKIGDSLTIFGFALSENDDHIMKKVIKGGVQRIAIAVFHPDGNLTDVANAHYARVKHLINTHSNHQIDIVFFDATSPGCWIN